MDQIHGFEGLVSDSYSENTHACNFFSHKLVFLSVLYAVSGDANFTMKHTGLTIGGFTQPVVAQNLIEIQANVEKGLCQRFLWVAPQPATVSFNDLQQVDQEFSTALGKQILINTHACTYLPMYLPVCHECKLFCIFLLNCLQCSST